MKNYKIITFLIIFLIFISLFNKLPAYGLDFDGDGYHEFKGKMPAKPSSSSSSSTIFTPQLQQNLMNSFQQGYQRGVIQNQQRALEAQRQAEKGAKRRRHVCPDHQSRGRKETRYRRRPRAR